MKRRLVRSVDRAIVDLATHQSREVTAIVLARYLECDPRTVTRIINDGTISAFKVGREWRIPIEEIRRAFPVKPHERAS